MKQDNVNKSEIIKKVFPMAEKTAEEFGLKFLEVDFVEEFNKWHLRIFIYTTERPITHEDCEKVTEKLAEPLDLIIPIPYYLEVSSPGTERKLKTSQEYLIFKGNRVKIKLKQSLDNNLKTFIGTIIDYNNEKGLIIKIEETNQTVEINEDNISFVKLEPKYKY